MAAVDYYLSVISPYTYLAGLGPAEIVARHGFELRYRPLDITALQARTGGIALAERHPSRKAYRLADIARQATRRAMPLNPQPMFFPANAAPASYALIAAQNAGGGDLAALVAAMTRVVWAEDKNIAEDEVIRACLAGAGFDPALADKGLFTGAETYGRNLEDAVAAGVFGVPSFVTPDGAVFWGQDRLDDLDAHLAALAA